MVIIKDGTHSEEPQSLQLTAHYCCSNANKQTRQTRFIRHKGGVSPQISTALGVLRQMAEGRLGFHGSLTHNIWLIFSFAVNR